MDIEKLAGLKRHQYCKAIAYKIRIRYNSYQPLFYGIKEYIIQGGRGHLAVYYTSPQIFIITFDYLLA